jgi:hypothetical protein
MFLSSVEALFLRSLIASHLSSLFCFSVRLGDRFSVPAHTRRERCAEFWSRLAEGHRAAARSGLDQNEHSAMLE